MNTEILHQIASDGAVIINSREFELCREQKHHFFSNVASHEVHVALMSLMLVRIFHINNVDEDALVRAALTHDFGMIGRSDNRYHSRRDIITRHPIESAKTAEEVLGGLSDCERDAITKHMWPLFTGISKYREGRILTIADKICATMEGLPGKDYAELIKSVSAQQVHTGAAA